MTHIRLFRHYFSAPYVVLALVEAGLLVLAVYLAIFTRFHIFGSGLDLNATQGNPYDLIRWKVMVFVTVMLISTLAMGVYQSRWHEGFAGMALRSLVAYFFIGSLGLSVVFYMAPSLFLGRGVLAIACVLALLLVSLARLLFYQVVSSDMLRRKVIVLGSGYRASQFAERLVALSRESTFDFEGFVHVGSKDALPLVEEDGVEKPLIQADQIVFLEEPLFDYVQRHHIDEIVVAVDERRRSDTHGSGQFPLDDLLNCKLSGVSVVDALTFFERVAGKIDLPLLHPSWLVFSDGFGHGNVQDIIQRIFDIMVSVVLICLTWPLMLGAWFAIKLEEGWRAPVIYKQVRSGRGGNPFKLLKFRSMVVNAESNGAQWAKKNDSRVTRVGEFMRKTRIDELPQLLNVLRGDMAFVGPRPERPEFVEKLAAKIPYYEERHRIKPGMMGWAQLKYPYGASEDDAARKLEFDLYYIKNKSLMLDIMIVVQTVEVILIGQGAR